MVHNWTSKNGVCVSSRVAPAGPSRRSSEIQSNTRDNKVQRWQFSHWWSCHTEQPRHQTATHCFFPDRGKWDLWNVSTSSSYLVRLQSASCRQVTHYCLATVWEWEKLTALRWQFYSWKHTQHSGNVSALIWQTFCPSCEHFSDCQIHCDWRPGLTTTVLFPSLSAPVLSGCVSW